MDMWFVDRLFAFTGFLVTIEKYSDGGEAVLLYLMDLPVHHRSIRASTRHSMALDTSGNRLGEKFWGLEICELTNQSANRQDMTS